MAQAAAVGFILREDYRDFRTACTDGAKMPSDYALFMKDYNQELKELRAGGVSPTQMTIKPGQFAEWCKANGHTADSKSRKAYADYLFGKLNFKRK